MIPQISNHKVGQAARSSATKAQTEFGGHSSDGNVYDTDRTRAIQEVELQIWDQQANIERLVNENSAFQE